MRVLFTTWEWPSHYLPMVPLAWALRSAGHEVLMTSQPALVPTMLKSGLPATSVGRDLDFANVYLTAVNEVRAEAASRRLGGGGGPRRPRRMELVSDHLVAAERDPRLRDRLRSLLALRDVEHETAAVYRSIRSHRNPGGVGGMSIYGEIADAMTDDLLDLCQTWRPDLIVFDPFTYAAPVVGALLGIPTVRNLFGPDVAYFSGAGELAGLMPVLEKHGLSTVDALGVATVDPCPPSLRFPDEMMPTRRIRHRYMPYNGMSETPRWVHDAPERPRICLTWGTSMVKLCGDEGFLPEELLQGAIKLAAERDAELVIAITKSQRGLLPPDLPQEVRVSEGVPLQALLPTCQALLHQGGAGTTLTALVSGLPQIVFTSVPDQSANAHLLVAAGAGKTMSTSGLNAADVLAAGHELLDDPAYAAAGQRIREEIRQQPTPAQIVPEIEALVG